MTVPDALLAALPFARRYARALTGSQAAGDALVARALPEREESLPPRGALYRAITRLAAQQGGPGAGTPVERQLLLLTALEEQPLEEAAAIVGLSEAEAAERLRVAREALRDAAATDVLIIEDEPIIAMDLRLLVERCGHRVVGTAASEDEALQIAAREPLGLILADVNLGQGGSGIAAVRRILTEAKVPVIFVTAYPEMLLTATGLEPAFVMRKPFDPLSLAIATYQATTAGRMPTG